MTKVASKPAANVGTVRQHIHLPFPRTPTGGRRALLDATARPSADAEQRSEPAHRAMAITAPFPRLRAPGLATR
jgi:hypothetical protein